MLGSKGCRSGESAHLPPMWLEFKSWRRGHMWVEFVVGSLLCSERFFSVYSGFPSPQKPTFPNSNLTRNGVDKEPLCGCATSKSLFIYLFIIYLSNESLLLVAVVAQVFKKPHIEKGEGRDKDNEEVDNSKHNPTSEFLRYIYRYIDVSKK